ncbi:conserved hypothetical protein [Aspergillus terreus NIH2624]|uniref:Major facilitator superfamily (MFS) profile domain-containing protein n=1 Tax=Aspergillus terreus (strain NIH 2624 / FGSC A1156) TaxID=341663 RepID=Q0CFS8_ASPTN|nr:uncharacterized protein ATEG_07456 [Aspergillus terreus NIH2624]EAU31718.1 conserved hypothetical protein [Aspergillus terreus NIH2624]
MARDIEKTDVPRPDCFASTVTECLFVLTVTFAFAQSTIFSGMATVMTDSIGRDLNMGDELTWITAAPLLTSGAFVLPFGNLADTVGRKRMFVAAMTCSTLVVTVAGFTPNGIILIVLNGFFGLFSAAAVTPAIGQLGSVYQQPSKRRNRAFACFSAGNPLGYVSGSFISGVVMQLSGWRACFWAFGVLNAIFTILVVWTVPSHSVPRKGSLWDLLSRFDLVGALLITGGVSMVSSSLTLGGTAPKGWGEPYVLIPLILGLATIICFVLWQAAYKHPLMPLHVWRDLDFAIHIISISIGNAGFTAATFWLCLYLQRVKHQSPLYLALYLLPQNVNGILVNIVISFFMHRVSHMLITGVGAIAYIISFLLLALIQPVSEYYWAFIFPSLMLVVVGSEMQFNVANSYVMSSLPQERQSLAGGILSAVNKIFSNVALTISTAAYATDIRRTTAGVGQLRLEKGYSGAFWVSVVLAVVDLFLVFFLRADGKGYAKSSLQRTKMQGSSASDEETGSEAPRQHMCFIF